MDPARFKVVVCGRQWGKALALDTPIATPSGWATMGSLRVGDEVFDETGAPTMVTFTSEIQMGRPCYEVVFDDGSKIVADAEHRWLTYSKKARKATADPRRHTEASVVTTEQMAGSLREGAETNHAIQVAQPLQYPETKVPIDPYVLGVWLGDGTSRTATITCSDKDSAIMAEVERRGYTVRQLDTGTRTPAWRIYDIQSDLRAMGILGAKRIPDAYLRGSVAQREELLKGLMDTDGGVEEGRLCSIASSYPALADDIHELILGLGYRVNRRVKPTPRQPSHRFTFFPWRPVFHLARKLRAQMGCPPGRKRYYRYVTDVRPVSSVPVRCIQVAAASSLFLAGRTLIPTHNTMLGAVLCVKEGLRGGDVWWVAPTYPIGQEGWEVIDGLARQIPGTKFEGRPNWKVTFPTGGTIQLRSSDNPDSLRGATLNGAVLDEAAIAKPETWPYLRPTLSVRKGWALFISTPKGLNWFHDIYADAEARKGWERWRFPSVSNPHMPADDVELARQEMSSLLFSQEYDAEFISTGSGMFRTEWIQHYRTQFDGEERVFILGDDAIALGSCTKFHTVDLAWSLEERADYTVISSWALTPHKHLILLDVIRGHFEGPDIVPKMRLAYEKWGGHLVVEKATRQMSIVQEAERTGLPVREVRAEKDKVARALPATARMEQQRVWFPAASTPWFREVEEELLAFPAGRHDDFVDTLSYAVAEAARSATGSGLLIV